MLSLVTTKADCRTAQALGGGNVAERAKEASANFGVPVLPFAGVAARLSGTGKPFNPVLSEI